MKNFISLFLILLSFNVFSQENVSWNSNYFTTKDSKKILKVYVKNKIILHYKDKKTFQSLFKIEVHSFYEKEPYRYDIILVDKKLEGDYLYGVTDEGDEITINKKNDNILIILHQFNGVDIIYNQGKMKI
jgi:hypothetical protein